MVKDANFENASIFLYEKNEKLLQRLAFSETEKSLPIPYLASIPLSQTENLIIQAITEKSKKVAASPADVLLTASEFAKPEIQQALSNIKSVHIFPLFVRDELLGVLVISLSEEDQQLSEYKHDLLIRLADSIGIGIDNSLLYNEVQSANKRLKQLDMLKDEFVSVASHELRTPMTAIKSYLWMALDGREGALPEKQKFYLGRAYTSVDRLIRLINDMLNVSRIDSGRISVQMQAVSLDKITQEVIDEVMPRAKELELELKMDSTIQLPQVLADTDKIKEVLFNLIGNSLKFTPKGGKVSVSFAQKDNMIETTISDTGTGIEPQDISKLFTKFNTIEDSNIPERTIPGSGLGLYISKSIIDLHGGKIWAQSEGHGKGTQFTFSLKVVSQADLEKLSKNLSGEAKPMVNLIHSDV